MSYKLLRKVGKPIPRHSRTPPILHLCPSHRSSTKHHANINANIQLATDLISTPALHQPTGDTRHRRGRRIGEHRDTAWPTTWGPRSWNSTWGSSSEVDTNGRPARSFPHARCDGCRTAAQGHCSRSILRSRRRSRRARAKFGCDAGC